MNTSVDVLTVLDAYVEFWSKELVRTRRDFDLHDAARSELAVVRNARDRVAELIEVAGQFDSYASADFGGTSILDNEELWDRLSAALSRVKGA